MTGFIRNTGRNLPFRIAPVVPESLIIPLGVHTRMLGGEENFDVDQFRSGCIRNMWYEPNHSFQVEISNYDPHSGRRMKTVLNAARIASMESDNGFGQIYQTQGLESVDVNYLMSLRNEIDRVLRRS